MKRPVLSALAVITLIWASYAPLVAEKKAPDWIFETPKPDSTNTYFVGSSSDQSGDASAAANDAATNLIASITQYLGVTLSSTTNAEARATLDSYSASIRSTVTSSSTNQIAGFSIKERFVQSEKKSKRVTVYVLAAYVTSDLEREKARILKALIEKIDAVAKPEAEGRSLEEDGRVYEAVRKYVEAAVAASGADIDNPDIKLERNINNARSALARLRFDASASAGYKGLVGSAFPKPFAAKLVAGEGSDAPGVPGALVLLSYQRKSGTRIVSKTEGVMTDSAGSISYVLPPPDFVGKGKLGLKLDFQSTIDLLDKLPQKFEPLRESLEREMGAKYLDVPYEVGSGARSVSMAVSLVDLDEDGSPVAGSKAQAGLLETLLREKFAVKGIAIPPEKLAAMDDAAVVQAVKTAGSFERVAFGTASVESVRKDGANYLANGKAVVKVLDLASGSLLYQAERGATGLGSDEKSARAAAYRELGRSAIGVDLLSSLQ
jgi:hypothetical protein